MVAVIFRSRLRAEHAEEYRQVAARINQLAAQTPGYLGIKTFSADDGERVSISLFENLAAVKQWQEQPEHREAQRLGKTTFYESYRVTVCEVVREYAFGPENAGADEAPEKL